MSGTCACACREGREKTLTPEVLAACVDAAEDGIADAHQDGGWDSPRNPGGAYGRGAALAVLKALHAAGMLPPASGAEAVRLQALLARYIDHVGQCEGVDFLSHRTAHDSDTTWTDEEWATLQECRDAIGEEPS